jgi:hypothetical protein
MIELASDLDDYEAILWFYPNYSFSQREMDDFVLVHQMEHDDSGMFYMTSIDRFFIIVFSDSMQERDSSNDGYVVYRRKMS